MRKSIDEAKRRRRTTSFLWRLVAAVELGSSSSNATKTLRFAIVDTQVIEQVMDQLGGGSEVAVPSRISSGSASINRVTR
jgi:hypothetical protein